MDLPAFLESALRRPFAWGRFDCALFAGAWAEALTGVDAGAPWRGRYSTALGCARLLKREGGLVAVMDRGAMLAGFTPTRTAFAGCVGAVAVTGPRGPDLAGAVFTGRRWALLTPGGLMFATPPPTAMWGCP